LKVSARSADGLSPSEEKLRVDAIRFLISKRYPEENIRVEATVKRFGHAGRNSLRADVAVLDTPVSSLQHATVDELLQHTVLLAEVKRDNRNYEQARSTQVKPMLDFAARTDCVGLYWDNVEQRVFWKEVVDGVSRLNEGPISALPDFGNRITTSPLTFETITPTDSLVTVFNRMEDILHAGRVAQSRRYPIMLQLLLAKLFDEHSHEARPDQPLDIQDFEALGTAPNLVVHRFNQVLEQAAGFYGNFLPSPIAREIPLTGATLTSVLRVLAPVKIIASKHSVVQDFYMKFAKGLYRWELGQYFTPSSVTDFIVDVLNPRFGEHIKDPACGSADFLTAAFRIGRQFDANYGANVWGADDSEEAVQVAVLNMLLNGDGKTNIVKEDSLVAADDLRDRYDAIVCNPPFGQQIVESRQDVLSRYALGHEWRLNNGVYEPTEQVLPRQETGLLFVEACVRQVKPGGRVGIILPNGYLGNRSSKYISFREWLLRTCRVASICAFPRFTFKGSGADVSASIVYLERRRRPLRASHEDRDYRFNVEIIQRVGWSVGDKRAKPLYRRDPEDGSYIINDAGEMMLDSDFEEIKKDIRTSNAVDWFPWLRNDAQIGEIGEGWSLPVTIVLDEATLCLDPKRHCRKTVNLREEIEARPHFRLGDVVDFLQEEVGTDGVTVSAQPGQVYRYVQLDDIQSGDFLWGEFKGWQLPSRARHFAEPGDVFIGSIWGSVRKWFYAPQDCQNLVVTNGCHRIRVKPDQQSLELDLLVGLCTDAYAVQMRAFARGSDGLAEVSADDAANVLLPRITADEARANLQGFVERLKAGRSRIDAEVRSLMQSGALDLPIPPPRPSHAVPV
jgi:type I restriction enzyme M protein